MSAPLYTDDDDGRPLISVEISDDIWLAEFVRALANAGLTLSNIPGRGLRVVRAPTPGQEDRR